MIHQLKYVVLQKPHDIFRELLLLWRRPLEVVSEARVHGVQDQPIAHNHGMRIPQGLLFAGLENTVGWGKGEFVRKGHATKVRMPLQNSFFI